METLARMASGTRSPRARGAGSPLARRAFLRGALLSVSAVAFGRVARADGDDGSRRLRMLHTHTGERVDVTWAERGRTLPDALAALDRFLRDFRTGDVHPIDPGVLDVVWRVAAAVGRPLATVEVVCGYRSPATNAALRARGRGVASGSLHLEGKAIDLRIPGVETAHLREAALALARGGVGFYRDSDFVHVDTGRVRWW